MCKDIPPIDIEQLIRGLNSIHTSYAVRTSQKDWYIKVSTLQEVEEYTPKQISDTITQKDTN